MHNNLGSALQDLGRLDEAVTCYRKALALAPEDPEVNNHRAWFLATCAEPSLRDASLAVRLATKAVDGKPQFPDYMKTLGVAQYRNGDAKAAVVSLEKAMRLRAGDDSTNLFFLAMAMLNEVIWRTQSTDVWVAFKAFGVIPLTMGFAVTQMPLIKRYHLEPASLQASEAEAGDVSKR